jgi:hypothetical protein
MNAIVKAQLPGTSRHSVKDFFLSYFYTWSMPEVGRSLDRISFNRILELCESLSLDSD